MKIKDTLTRLLAVGLALLIAVPLQALAQESGTQPMLRQEELDQVLAPIALYPDALISQIFMASTYPLEVVQADRWVKENKTLEGDALSAALEQQGWDPSVKSLVNFPQVLAMMSERLDWMTKLGDAFIAQQKDVMDTVQQLRGKAKAEGNLKTTKEQKVVVEQQIIKIESPAPQVIYVPTYNPTVVYGTWWYPAYPPYVYHPPGYVAGAALFSFGVGIAIGAAWGYAWGGSNWRRGRVDININRNINVNRNINRGRYRADMQRRGHISAGGKGAWQHNAAHRKGVAYRDRGTAQRFNRGASRDAVRGRENFRGRAEAGRRDLGRGKADQFKGRQQGGRGTTGDRRSRATTRSRGGSSAFQGANRGRTSQVHSKRGRSSRSSMGSSRSRGSRGGGRRGGGRRR
ncbi:MAG: DUF3300 domain-containing protein [bacterium]|nr:DUF3300 domain-containing protein [bacterium]